MTDTSNWLNESDYEKHDAFKFVNVGDTITGEIVDQPRLVETQDLTGDGTSKKLVLTVRTDSGDTYSVWIRKGRMAKAVAEAVKKAGVTELAAGGRIAIKHSAVGAPTKPGFSPPKLFEAGYKPPAPSGINVDDLLA